MKKDLKIRAFTTRLINISTSGVNKARKIERKMEKI
uniref:Uncharacterized protein n=1 Tax=Siphoviridae sp. ctZHD14 TaxID=2827891 RepID=A0A8S5SWX6_9CAUD|nr:MAG TPA: hypothetical protein [Siphoviridae sp. ctZHD14]